MGRGLGLEQDLSCLRHGRLKGTEHSRTSVLELYALTGDFLQFYNI